jgi:hypothetical protein
MDKDAEACRAVGEAIVFLDYFKVRPFARTSSFCRRAEGQRLPLSQCRSGAGNTRGIGYRNASSCLDDALWFPLADQRQRVESGDDRKAR